MSNFVDKIYEGVLIGFEIKLKDLFFSMHYFFARNFFLQIPGPTLQSKFVQSVRKSFMLMNDDFVFSWWKRRAGIFGTSYSSMDQVKFVKDSL